MGTMWSTSSRSIVRLRPSRKDAQGTVTGSDDSPRSGLLTARTGSPASNDSTAASKALKDR